MYPRIHVVSLDLYAQPPAGENSRKEESQQLIDPDWALALYAGTGYAFSARPYVSYYDVWRYVTVVYDWHVVVVRSYSEPAVLLVCWYNNHTKNMSVRVALALHPRGSIYLRNRCIFQ